jgi:thiol:disulfide interchange protein DsbD
MAQDKDPISWTYESKKKADNSYDLLITASLPKPWHIYSQNTDENGPIPTTITFNVNPLITKVGKITETGKLEKKYDKDMKANTLYYSDKVVFTQNIKLKGKAKTVVTGKINFMVCNDVKCLPPKDVAFTIKL